MKILTLTVLEGNVDTSITMELTKTSPVELVQERILVDEKDWETFETGVRELGDALRELRRSKAS